MSKYRPILTLLVFLAVLKTTESTAQCSLPEQPNLNGPSNSCQGDHVSNYVIPAPGANSEGTNYTIHLSGGGELTILSDPTPPGEKPSAFHLSIAWTQSGTHTLTVTPVNACGAGPSVSMNITVGFDNEDIIAVEETDLCGASYTLSVPVLEGYQYQWNLNNNPIDGATTPTYAATQSGNYSITITNAAACTFTSNVKVITIDALPPAFIVAEGATTFCAGGSVLLNASTTQSGLTYQWKLNGTDITNATNPSYTASSAGDYTVTITVASSCTATSLPTSVVVNTLPVALATAASTTTFCSGGSVILSANTEADLHYQWRVYDTPISGATSASYTAIESGLYSVRITNSAGCSLSSTTIPVTVNPLPTATLTPGGSTTFCAGGNVTLYANTGSGLSYQWKLNDANIPNATGYSYAAIQTGAYSVSITNSVGCLRNSSPRTVTVNPLPQPTITPAGTTAICSGGSVVLNANTGYALQYLWRMNGESIAGATNGSYSATASGAYSLTVTNVHGCVATSNPVVVGVVENLIQVSINEGESSLEVCDQATLTLNAHTVGDNLSFAWSRNGVLVPGVNTPTLTVVPSPDETIMVRVAAPGNCSAEASVQVQVTNSEDVSLSVTSEHLQRITPYQYRFCEGSTITLSSSALYSHYQWKKEGIDILEATIPIVSVTEPGQYSLLGTSAAGCTKLSRTVTLEVSEAPTLSLNYEGSLTKCINDFLKLETQNLPTYSYQWLKDGNAFSLGDPGVKQRLTFFTPLAPTDAGTYSLKVTSSMGCETISPEVTLIINSTYPPATIEGLRGNSCSPNGIELRANTGNDLSYQWKLNGETIPTATANIHYAKIAGTYAVEVSQNACSKLSDSRYVEVSTPLVVTIDGPESVCPRKGLLPAYDHSNYNIPNIFIQHQVSSSLTARISTQDGVVINPRDYFILWIGGSSTQDPMVRKIASPGDYKISLIHKQYRCRYKASKTVKNYSKVKPTIEQSGDVCSDQVVTLTSSLADAYRWSTGERTRSIIASPSTSYTVTTISSKGGCQSTSVAVSVEPCSETSQFSMEEQVDTSIESVTEVNLFPNPADQIITLTLPQIIDAPFSLRIRDHLGKIHSETFFKKKESMVQIHTGTLSNGIYILELKTQQGSLLRKVMISHRQ